MATPHPHYSLTRKLLVYTSIFSILMGCLLVVSAYRIALEETNEILDAQMKYLAERIGKFNPQPVQSNFNHLKHYHEEDLFVDVWSYKKNEHQYHAFHLLIKPVQQAGFYTHETNAGRWHTYVLPLKDLQVQISQQDSVRQNLALELAINMFLPYALIMPFAIWGLSLIIRRNLKPLENFKTELTQRKPNELEPISSHDYPIEIVPSIDEINHLFERISHTQQEQRQFIADAAHELRTPITALNLQTQILLSELPNHSSLKNLSKGLDRVQHLVNQLLSLAKQDAALSQDEVNVEISLNEEVIYCIEQLMNLALRKEIDLGMEKQEVIVIHTQASHLRSVLMNLIDNAIKYTPQHGIINLSVYHEYDSAIIQIEDSGPGISPEKYNKILKRFYRVHQHLEIGSGLGLSIVDKAVHRLGGTIEFSQSQQLGGLQVQIRLPLTAKP
ncbi:sensor histidine kinase [Acinetobacter shaoyimingii]|uniref:histidine kinase n=1 Tax=Acinetobacter shaoyimingii TaxID=2715164 RepID=A0A6G8RVK8_9GAMM|nr:ATP-binding protein [Acinetobacter shaoyimingii]QIO05828.1 GHKL domain-containing protein [Acinetobacter shaoyimingii]